MIDIAKQYRTRDGREVRLLMTDGGGDCPVIGAFKRCDGVWVSCDWPASGCCSSLSKLDLIEVKPKHVRWININPDSGFPTRKDADLVAWNKRMACIRIEFEEGEGLP
jgi:hypothetical protein